MLILAGCVCVCAGYLCMYFIVVWWYVGVDRLDKELTIAQMQGEHVYVVSTLMMFVCVGKFQMTRYTVYT